MHSNARVHRLCGARRILLAQGRRDHALGCRRRDRVQADAAALAACSAARVCGLGRAAKHGPWQLGLVRRRLRARRRHERVLHHLRSDRGLLCLRALRRSVLPQGRAAHADEQRGDDRLPAARHAARALAAIRRRQLRRLRGSPRVRRRRHSGGLPVAGHECRRQLLLDLPRHQRLQGFCGAPRPVLAQGGRRGRHARAGPRRQRVLGPAAAVAAVAARCVRELRADCGGRPGRRVYPLPRRGCQQRRRVLRTLHRNDGLSRLRREQRLLLAQGWRRQRHCLARLCRLRVRAAAPARAARPAASRRTAAAAARRRVRGLHRARCARDERRAASQPSPGSARCGCVLRRVRGRLVI